MPSPWQVWTRAMKGGGNGHAIRSAAKRQIRMESGQLWRFQRNPNTNDEVILAQTITKADLKGSGTRRDVRIASCDCGFFFATCQKRRGV